MGSEQCAETLGILAKDVDRADRVEPATQLELEIGDVRRIPDEPETLDLVVREKFTINPHTIGCDGHLEELGLGMVQEEINRHREQVSDDKSNRLIE